MKRIDFTLEEVLDDIKRVNLECGSCSFTIYERKGRYSPQLFKRKLPFLRAKKYGQKIYSSFDIGIQQNLKFQDGDGDVIFT